MATTERTWAYRERFGDDFARAFYRSFAGCVVSSVGVGTYLGEPTDHIDRAYSAVIQRAVESGVNVLDTAINYRHQRSERVIGSVLNTTDIAREAILIATKGGFIPFDDRVPADPQAVVRKRYVDTGLLEPRDLVRGQHSLAPDFLSDQLDRSLANLGVETIDLYYVHNPETQLERRSEQAVYDQLETAFELLEERADQGDIRHYGVATWDAFRVTQSHPSYLSLSTVIERARNAAATVGNSDCHLAAIQLPFNVEMADAFTVAAHGAPGDRTALDVATDAELAVMTSASLKQGELTADFPAQVASRVEGDSPAQRAINFARSAPGVTTALVGTTSVDHVTENVAAGTHPPLGARSFDAVFE